MPSALIVDSDPDTRELYGEVLKATVSDISYSSDGRDALAKVIGEHPALVITETRLPFIDGYTLCELVRADPDTQHIPIIVVTGDAFPDQMERARRSGADSVLKKPCSNETLLAAIASIQERSQRLRERSEIQRATAADCQTRSKELLERSKNIRTVLVRAHRRYVTAMPPAAPPSVVCPVCDRQLKYVNSHIGGVSDLHSEQWDYFECAGNCGTFQYRHRTRKLRRVS